MINKEIKVKYQAAFDRVLVMIDGTISSVMKFNGCQIFLDESGTVIGYLINSYSKRFFLLSVFSKLLGESVSDLEEVYGLS